MPPEWHAWLHRNVDEPPIDGAPSRPWQKPHIPNLTGTAQAYRPPGDLARGVGAEGAADPDDPEAARREPVAAPYRAWRP